MADPAFTLFPGSVPCEKPLMGKKAIGLGFSCFHAYLADPATEGDKLLAADSLSRE